MAKKCRILLIDDEKDICFAIKNGLEENGFQVDAFTDPKVALSSFRAGIHKILISDIRMPGMSGIQLSKEIRKLDAKVKVIFLTAFEIQEKEWHMLLPHCDAKGFIKKPAKIEYLLDAIKQIKVSQSC